MERENGRFVVYGNPLKRSYSRAIVRRQRWLVRKFDYDPNERYTLSVHENPYLGPIFGVKDILRDDSVIHTYPDGLTRLVPSSSGNYKLSFRGG